MIKLKKGNLVKLNEKGIRVHLATGGAPVRSHQHIDWTTRTGTVVRIVRGNREAAVQWQGRKTVEALSLTILEQIYEDRIIQTPAAC